MEFNRAVQLPPHWVPEPRGRYGVVMLMTLSTGYPFSTSTRQG
jgi:hypothetical protein